MEVPYPLLLTTPRTPASLGCHKTRFLLLLHLDPLPVHPLDQALRFSTVVSSPDTHVEIRKRCLVTKLNSLVMITLQYRCTATNRQVLQTSQLSQLGRESHDIRPTVLVSRFHADPYVSQDFLHASALIMRWNHIPPAFRQNRSFGA